MLIKKPPLCGGFLFWTTLGKSSIFFVWHHADQLRLRKNEPGQPLTAIRVQRIVGFPNKTSISEMIWFSNSQIE